MMAARSRRLPVIVINADNRSILHAARCNGWSAIQSTA
jgi:hypothetical protein